MVPISTLGQISKSYDALRFAAGTIRPGFGLRGCVGLGYVTAQDSPGKRFVGGRTFVPAAEVTFLAMRDVAYDIFTGSQTEVWHTSAANAVLQYGHPVLDFRPLVSPPINYRAAGQRLRLLPQEQALANAISGRMITAAHGDMQPWKTLSPANLDFAKAQPRATAPHCYAELNAAGGELDGVYRWIAGAATEVRYCPACQRVSANTPTHCPSCNEAPTFFIDHLNVSDAFRQRFVRDLRNKLNFKAHRPCCYVGSELLKASNAAEESGWCSTGKLSSGAAMVHVFEDKARGDRWTFVLPVEANVVDAGTYLAAGETWAEYDADDTWPRAEKWFEAWENLDLAMPMLLVGPVVRAWFYSQVLPCGESSYLVPADLLAGGSADDLNAVGVWWELPEKAETLIDGYLGGAVAPLPIYRNRFNFDWHGVALMAELGVAERPDPVMEEEEVAHYERPRHNVQSRRPVYAGSR